MGSITPFKFLFIKILVFLDTVGATITSSLIFIKKDTDY